MKKIYTLYSLSIGFSLNLVFVIMFYFMLYIGNSQIIVDANQFNEYWIEFILIQVCMIFTTATFFIEAWNYYKKKVN